MANADVIYAIAVQGASDAIAAFNAVNEASKKAAATAHLSDLTMTSGAKNVNTFSTRVNALADSFKMVSRDIGTVGGQAAQTFTHIADEALSVVGILSGPSGMAAGIAVAGVAVGALAFAYSAASKKADEYKKIADEALKKNADEAALSVKKLSDEYAEAARQADNYNEASVRADLVGLERALEKKQSELFVARDKDEKQRLDAEVSELARRRDATSYRLKEIGEEKVARAEVEEAEKEANKQEDARKKARDESRKKEAEDFVAFSTLRERAAMQEMAIYAAAGGPLGQLLSMHMQLKAASNSIVIEDQWSDLSGDVERADKATQALGAAMPGLGGMMLQAASAIEKLHGPAARMSQDFKDDEEASKKAKDALKKHNEEIRKATEERKKLNDEVRKTLLLGAGEQAFSASYGAGMFVIGNATSFASGQLKEFGNINRDNWRDTLAMTEDKKAAFLAEAQAALFNMGVQAGVKSFFEQAEALKESALMFGSLAMNDPKGVAAHGAAAAGHAVAAGAYSMIAVGGVGASLGIGAMRGGGGLAAAGPGAGGARGGPSPSGGGGAAGPRAPGANDGGGATNITFVYEAGSINAADERATARTVANGVGAARGSWFERRRMERRV